LINNLQTSSVLRLLEKAIQRNTIVGFDRARKTIFGHSSNCGTECRSDGTIVEYTWTAKGVLIFWEIFSIGLQPKELLGHLHGSPSLKIQYRSDDNQPCKIEIALLLDACFTMWI